MNLLYDLTAAQPTPESKFHGAGEYGEVIFLKLIETICAQDTRIFAAWDSSRDINKILLQEAACHNVTLIDIQKENMNGLFRTYKINRFYSALLDSSIQWPLADAEIITTVHGLRSLEMPLNSVVFQYERTVKGRIKDFLKLYILPRYFFRKIYDGYARFFEGNMTIITVSNHSKASILSFFPSVKPGAIQVFSSPTFNQIKGYEIIPADFSSLSDKYGIERHKYFLITSCARWIKNAARAVEAFSSLDLHGYKVVLTGVSDKRVFKQIIHNKDDFVLLDYVDREVLESLNKNAYAFIYPSLNEGFGYPPLDAMKYGVPVAASCTSAIPEVCGSAALYFDPYSVSEIRNRIIQLFDSSIYAVYASRSCGQYEAVSRMQENDLINMVNFLLKNDTIQK
jgi:glycosyltransferase involved in cell wall biosynthesis